MGSLLECRTLAKHGRNGTSSDSGAQVGAVSALEWLDDCPVQLDERQRTAVLGIIGGRLDG
jgi:hypothetical protein